MMGVRAGLNVLLVVRIAYFGAFAAFLLGVLSASLLPFAAVLPLQENRTKSPFPDPMLLLDNSTAPAFAEKLNLWVDDRVGLRDLFIRIKNQIDYSAFSASRKVYVGSDGVLFNRDLTDARLNIERISEAAYRDLEQRLAALFASHVEPQRYAA
jgi:hypothetical protein